MRLLATKLTSIASAVRNLFWGASLNMNFAGTDTLDPRITFSRASNATVTGPDGTLGYAPHNLLTHSEQFDAAAWGKALGTVIANAASSPDGTSTMDAFIEGSGAVNPSLAQNQTVSAGFVYTLSSYARERAGSAKRYLTLLFPSAQFGANVRATFDLAAGAYVTTNGPVAAGMTLQSDGSYRCFVSAACTASGITTPNIRLAAVSPDTIAGYTGDGVSGLFIWGAQLNVGPLQPYYPTTVKNLLGYTQEFDNAAWTKSNATVTANDVIAPDGSMTADKLVEDAATTSHGLFQTASGSFSQAPYTVSIYAKAAERTAISFWIRGASSLNRFEFVANLLNGEISAAQNLGNFTNGAATTTSVGGGWYRISAVVTPAAGETNIRLQPFVYTSGIPSAAYTGDGTSGIYIWGAQLSDSASPDPYVYNPAEAPAASAYYGPRFDYDPVTLQPKGLLIEEQRTNSIRNSTMQGAVAGTPGTDPTIWAITPTQNNVTKEIVGVGTENGVAYIDVRYSGTPTSGGARNIIPETSTQIVAANGQTWTGSVYLRVVGGSLSGVTSVRFNVVGRTSTGVGVSGQTGSVVITPTNAGLVSQRFSQTTAFTDATVERVNTRLDIEHTTAPIDITLRIGMPQLELGAFATSVIPTTTAAATRAADVAVMTGANFSNWYSQAQGSVYGEFINLMPGSASASIQNAGLWAAADSSLVSTFNGYGVRIAPSVSTASAIQFTGRSGAVTQNATRAAIGFPSAGATYKTAASWDASFMQFALNGQAGTAVTNTVAALLSAQNIFHIGSQTVGGSPPYALNGHIRKIACFPRRLTNSELQGLTS